MSNNQNEINLNLLDELLRKNPTNKEFLGNLNMKIIPQNLRNIIFRRVCFNKKMQSFMSKKKIMNEINSEYQDYIYKEIFNMLSFLRIPENSFNNDMILSIKILLTSYQMYSKKLPNSQLFVLSFIVVKSFENDYLVFKTMDPLFGNPK